MCTVSAISWPAVHLEMEYTRNRRRRRGAHLKQLCAEAQAALDPMTKRGR